VRAKRCGRGPGAQPSPGVLGANDQPPGVSVGSSRALDLGAGCQGPARLRGQGDLRSSRIEGGSDLRSSRIEGGSDLRPAWQRTLSPPRAPEECGAAAAVAVRRAASASRRSPSSSATRLGFCTCARKPPRVHARLLCTVRCTVPRGRGDYGSEESRGEAEVEEVERVVAREVVTVPAACKEQPTAAESARGAVQWQRRQGGRGRAGPRLREAARYSR
jgi:hypothetical protein